MGADADYDALEVRERAEMAFDEMRDKIATLRAQLAEAKATSSRVMLCYLGHTFFWVEGTPVPKKGDCPWCQLATLQAEVEQLQVQLAGCLTAAEGHRPDPAVDEQAYGWSPAYATTLTLRLDYERLRADASEDLFPEILQAFGEVSALFMSQPDPGTSIVMPTQDLERIAHDLAMRVSKYSRAQVEALREALHDIAGGHTRLYADAPDVMTAESPAAFQHDMWTWSQRVARAALDGDGEKEKAT